jgi:hypothetical protein
MEYSFVERYKGRLEVFGYSIDKMGLQPENGNLVAWRPKRITPRNGAKPFTLAHVVEIINPKEKIEALPSVQEFKGVKINTDFRRNYFCKDKSFRLNNDDCKELRSLALNPKNNNPFFFWVQGLDSDERRNGNKIYILDKRTNENNLADVQIKEIIETGLSQSPCFQGITLVDSKESYSYKLSYLDNKNKKPSREKYKHVCAVSSRYGHSKGFLYDSLIIQNWKENE